MTNLFLLPRYGLQFHLRLIIGWDTAPAEELTQQLRAFPPAATDHPFAPSTVEVI